MLIGNVAAIIIAGVSIVLITCCISIGIAINLLVEEVSITVCTVVSVFNWWLKQWQS